MFNITIKNNERKKKKKKKEKKKIKLLENILEHLATNHRE